MGYKHYPEKLRLEAIKAIRDGMTYEEVSKTLEVKKDTLYDWVYLEKKGIGVKPRTPNRLMASPLVFEERVAGMTVDDFATLLSRLIESYFNEKRCREKAEAANKRTIGDWQKIAGEANERVQQLLHRD